MFALLSLVFLVSGAADGGLAPPFQLHANMSPTTVKLGEPASLEIVVTHPTDQRYELKTPSDLGDFEYLGQERKRVDGADQSTTTIRVSLAAFQIGTLDTPNLELEVASPGGAALLPVPRTKLTVVTSLPADAQTKGENLYDVRTPEEVTVRSWRLLWVLAGLVAAGLIFWLVRRQLNKPKAPKLVIGPPPEPLPVRTRKALDALAKEDLPGRGEFKAFYFRLSEIVRGYLGELYGFDAMESTTPELMGALRTRSTPGLAVKELEEFAQSSDFVRYAKTEPTVDECKTHLELAYRIVQTTQPRSPPA